jgi:long-chain fatty acid transport protein
VALLFPTLAIPCGGSNRKKTAKQQPVQKNQNKGVKKQSVSKKLLVSSAVLLAVSAFATNGDNMMAIGPIARAMGGVGIASPQDAISAVFANPAAMCFTPGCAYSEVNFAGTIFMPHPQSSVKLQGVGNYNADSKQNIYAIPAIGLSVPIDPETRRWRFGLAAYGATGLGVDYRGTGLNQNFPGTGYPLVQGAFSSLMIMKFAPSISYEISPNLSVGTALNIDYATLDLGSGSSPAYGIGGQFGVIYRPAPEWSLGAIYITPQNMDFGNVVQTSPGTYHALELESPQQAGIGISRTFMDGRLLIEVDGKYINWAGATGYKDFGWQDQWVAGLGAQFALVPKKLFLRAGYNYANNPVQTQNGWGAGMHNVQGMMFPDYYYETFRMIGFPAIVEQHVTCGIGYAFSEKFEINLAYTHAFENTSSESGSAMGVPATISSSLSEDSVDFGLTFRF